MGSGNARSLKLDKGICGGWAAWAFFRALALKGNSLFILMKIKYWLQAPNGMECKRAIPGMGLALS